MATLSELQALYDAAKASYDAAVFDRDSKYSASQSAHSDLSQCHCGKGKTLSGVCTPLTNIVSYGNVANIADCVNPPNINNCKTSCCSKGTCEQRVSTYNNSLAAYNSAAQSVSGKKQILDSADAALKAHPEYSKSEIEAGTNRFVVVTIALVVVAALVATGVYLWKKYKK